MRNLPWVVLIRIVKEIYRMYLEGHSRLSISESASSRVSNRTIDHNIIRDMLARPVYKGNLHNAGAIVEGIHEAIIEEDVWEAVQRETKLRQEGSSPKGEF